MNNKLEKIERIEDLFRKVNFESIFSKLEENKDSNFKKELIKQLIFVCDNITNPYNYCGYLNGEFFVGDSNTDKVLFKESDLTDEGEFPKLMMVSNDIIRWYKRIVFMEKYGKFFAHKRFEDPENNDIVRSWDYIKGIDEKTKISKKKIAESLGIPIEDLEVVD